MQLKDFRYVYHKVGDHVITFEISDVYDPSVTGYSGTDNYYGYLADNGAWLIMKEVPSAGTYRYAAGSDSYAAHWAARAGKTYVYYNSLT